MTGLPPPRSEGRRKASCLRPGEYKVSKKERILEWAARVPDRRVLQVGYHGGALKKRFYLGQKKNSPDILDSLGGTRDNTQMGVAPNGITKRMGGKIHATELVGKNRQTPGLSVGRMARDRPEPREAVDGGPPKIWPEKRGDKNAPRKELNRRRPSYY